MYSVLEKHRWPLISEMNRLWDVCMSVWKHQAHVHGDTDTHTPSIQSHRLLSTSAQYVYLNFLLTTAI